MLLKKYFGGKADGSSTSFNFTIGLISVGGHKMKKHICLICALFVFLFTACACGEGAEIGPSYNSEVSGSADYTEDTEHLTGDSTALTRDTGGGSGTSSSGKTGDTKSEGTAAKTDATTTPPTKKPGTTTSQNNGGVIQMDYAVLRSGMLNTIYKLKNNKKLTVGYIGGSVTSGYGASNENNSWRVETEKWLKNAFPGAQITAVNASIGGTGSELAMYRLEHDLLKHNPDLVFIEFAVNDAYINYTSEQIMVQIETICRKINNKNPYTDIIMVYVNDSGRRSDNTIPAYETIADLYKTNSVNVYSAVLDAMDAENRPFSYYFMDHVHPNDMGYKVYADTIIGVLQETLKGSSSGLTAKKLPNPRTNVKMNATLYRPDQTPLNSNNGWENRDQFPWLGSTYGGSLTSNKDGSVFTIKLKGTDFGILYEIGPNAGSIRYSVDGGAEKTLDGNYSYSTPTNAILFRGLKDEVHTITITFKALSAGKEFNIGAFLVAGTVLQ